jgi:hypothetical protein
MCRWMAWFGRPPLIGELLFKLQRGIVDHSLYARVRAEPTIGDGVGRPRPSTTPSRRPGAKPTCASSRPTSSRSCSSPTSGQRSARACERPTAIRFRHEQWLFVRNGFHRRLPSAQARAHARHRRRPVCRGSRIDGHGGRLPPRHHGGFLESVAYRSASCEGATHVLVLRSRPAGHRLPSYRRVHGLAMRLASPELASLLQDRATRYGREAGELERLPSRPVAARRGQINATRPRRSWPARRARRRRDRPCSRRSGSSSSGEVGQA